MTLTRRRFRVGTGAAAATALLAPCAAVGQAWRQGRKLVLLGTMAGPVLATNRMVASQAAKHFRGEIVVGRDLLII
jgi:hypothetical protein